MRWTKLVLPAGLALAAACGSDKSDASHALPSADAVTINAPSSNQQALTIGGASSFYVTTFVATVGVNATVKGVFDSLEDIAKNPPTSTDGDTSTWGPGGGALDPHTYELVVTGKDAVYDYHFDAKLKSDTTGDFQKLLEGHSDKSSGKNDGTGTLTIHNDVWAQINGRDCDRGDVDVAYDTTVEPQTLVVTFHGFRSCDDSSTTPYSAIYYYDRFTDGSGDFEFSTDGDAQNGAHTPVVLEDLVMRSRWNADGSGRSDAEISGGDLSLDGLSQVTASECWSASFTLTYAVTDPQTLDENHQGGAVTDCPSNMQDASYAVDNTAAAQ